MKKISFAHKKYPYYKNDSLNLYIFRKLLFDLSKSDLVCVQVNCLNDKSLCGLYLIYDLVI